MKMIPSTVAKKSLKTKFLQGQNPRSTQFCVTDAGAIKLCLYLSSLLESLFYYGCNAKAKYIHFTMNKES